MCFFQSGSKTASCSLSTRGESHSYRSTRTFDNVPRPVIGSAVEKRLGINTPLSSYPCKRVSDSIKRRCAGAKFFSNPEKHLSLISRLLSSPTNQRTALAAISMMLPMICSCMLPNIFSPDTSTFAFVNTVLLLLVGSSPRITVASNRHSRLLRRVT